MIETFETFNSDLYNKIIEATSVLKGMGNYKDANDFWHIKENIDISNTLIFSHEGKLVIKFGTVKGDFIINSLGLTTLKGCPIKVEGDFSCEQNSLTNLIGSPKNIKGYFSCMQNKLTSLEGGPSYVGEDYICNNNKLTSLKGIQSIIKNSLYCSTNKLINLIDGPSEILEKFYCSYNKLISLEGGLYNVKDRIIYDHNINNLKIETEFIKSGSYKNDYWLNLLTYMIKEKISLEKVKGWPDEFLNNNLVKSAKNLGKFNL